MKQHKNLLLVAKELAYLQNKAKQGLTTKSEDGKNYTLTVEGWKVVPAALMPTNDQQPVKFSIQ